MPVYIVRPNKQENAVPPEQRVTVEREIPKSFLSVKQAAAYAGVSEPTIRRKIKDKSLAYFRLGVQIRIDPCDLVALMRSNGQR